MWRTDVIACAQLRLFDYTMQVLFRHTTCRKYCKVKLLLSTKHILKPENVLYMKLLFLIHLIVFMQMWELEDVTIDIADVQTEEQLKGELAC